MLSIELVIKHQFNNIKNVLICKPYETEFSIFDAVRLLDTIEYAYLLHIFRHFRVSLELLQKFMQIGTPSEVRVGPKIL